jgi:hypothetical protein
MNRSQRLQVLGMALAISLLQMGLSSFDAAAQSTSPEAESKHAQTLDCSSGIQVFPVPAPSEDEAASDANKPQVRASFALNSKVSLDVVEHPDSDSLTYGTEVIVKREKGEDEHHQIAKLIGEPRLRLVHVAQVCSGPTNKTLVLEYEGNPTGAIEGFALIRYLSSDESVEVYTLPIAQQGKIVVFKNRPDYVQVWTTAPGGSITSQTSERRYRIRSCSLQNGRFECSTKGRIVGTYSPGSIDDPGIEIK